MLFINILSLNLSTVRQKFFWNWKLLKRYLETRTRAEKTKSLRHNVLSILGFKTISKSLGIKWNGKDKNVAQLNVNQAHYRY